MRRIGIVSLAAAIVAATVANPHFLHGGAFDVYGAAGPLNHLGAWLDLSILALAVGLLWRGQSLWAPLLLVSELALYAGLVIAGFWRAGLGYVSDGWGGSYWSVLAAAFTCRALLLWWSTQRAQSHVRLPAT